MCKAGRIVLMAAGTVAMGVILVMFGFVETNIPPAGYLGMWVICAGIIDYGAEAGVFLTGKGSGNKENIVKGKEW